MYRISDKYKITLLLLVLQSFVAKAQTKTEPILSDLSVNIGLTCFKNPYKDDFLNNDMAHVAKACFFGLEFYNKKANLSFEAKKTMWVSFTSSNGFNDVNAWASYGMLGFTKYINVFKHKKLGINVSHNWIAENAFNESYKWPLQQSNFLVFYFNRYYTARAISLAPSINLTKKLHVEVRANLYYFTRQDTIPTANNTSKGINSNRLQFSLIYKINPLKK